MAFIMDLIYPNVACLYLDYCIAAKQLCIMAD